MVRVTNLAMCFSALSIGITITCQQTTTCLSFCRSSSRPDIAKVRPVLLNSMQQGSCFKLLGVILKTILNRRVIIDLLIAIIMII